MSQTVRKIYLHWAATPYNWAVPGHYHTVIQGDGSIRRLTGYEQFLPEHTYGRNRNAAALCIACMGGKIWEDYPPTSKQIESLCKEVAHLAKQLGWRAEDINIQRVMTHAEAAGLRDFPIEKARQGTGVSPARARQLGLPHDNYGPQSWHDGPWPTGTAERWDLWQLKKTDQGGIGGFILRDKIKAYMTGQSALIQPISPVQRLRECHIYLNNSIVSNGLIFSDNKCYAKITELAKAFSFQVQWNKNERYVNLIRTNIRDPKYATNSPLVNGYQVVDIYLNRINDSNEAHIYRPFIEGIIVDGAVWVQVSEFANELSLKIEFSDDDSSIYLGNLMDQEGRVIDAVKNGLSLPEEQLGASNLLSIKIISNTTLRPIPMDVRQLIKQGLKDHLVSIKPGEYKISSFKRRNNYFWVTWDDHRINRDSDYINAAHAEISGAVNHFNDFETHVISEQLSTIETPSIDISRIDSITSANSKSDKLATPSDETASEIQRLDRWDIALLNVKTKGASARTASQDGLSGGVSASHQMAKTDWPRVKPLVERFYEVAVKFDVPPALLAAIASRESRCGAVLTPEGLGDRGNAFGIMQVDRRFHKQVGLGEDPASEEHILQGAKILNDFRIKVKRMHPKWEDEHILKGCTVAYNAGPSTVQTTRNMDKGSTGNDYGSDVIARAQFYANRMKSLAECKFSFGTVTNDSLSAVSIPNNIAAIESTLMNIVEPIQISDLNHESAAALYSSLSKIRLLKPQKLLNPDRNKLQKAWARFKKNKSLSQPTLIGPSSVQVLLDLVNNSDDTEKLELSNLTSVDKGKLKQPRKNLLGLWLPPLGVEDFTLPVNHYAQIDNSSGEGFRECYMTVCTMLADYVTHGRLSKEKRSLGLAEPEDAYRRYMEGDTTKHWVHEKALRKLGIEAYFSDTASIKDVMKSLDKGIPVPVGVKYKTSGHWMLVNGRSSEGWDVLCPNGIRDGKSNNWVQRFRNESEAKSDSFSWNLLKSVFADLGPENGYAVFVTAVDGISTGIKKGM